MDGKFKNGLLLVLAVRRRIMRGGVGGAAGPTAPALGGFLPTGTEPADMVRDSGRLLSLRLKCFISSCDVSSWNYCAS